MPRTFRARKASFQTAIHFFRKGDLLTCFVLFFFFYVRKIKRIAKFEGLEPRHCQDIKGIMAPEIGPKSFGTFEKKAPVAE